MNKAEGLLFGYTTLFIWLIPLGIGLLVEKLAAAIKNPPQNKSGGDAGMLNLVNGLIITTISFVVTPLVSTFSAMLTHHLWSGLINIQPAIHNKILSQACAILMIAFVYDFFYYWWHRAEHRFLPLWHIHAVHHSDQHMNASTYIRKNWLELVLRPIVVSIPVAMLFKLPAANFFLASLFMASWGTFGHLNIRLNMGWLTPVIGAPQYHRIHHSIERKHQDKNFAQYFPLFDILFSTYHRPEKDEYPETGLYSGEKHDTLTDMLLDPIIKLCRRHSKSQ